MDREVFIAHLLMMGFVNNTDIANTKNIEYGYYELNKNRGYPERNWIVVDFSSLYDEKIRINAMSMNECRVTVDQALVEVKDYLTNHWSI